MNKDLVMQVFAVWLLSTALFASVILGICIVATAGAGSHAMHCRVALPLEMG